MPIVVEDGTGLANAVSYLSVADATAYFTARNVIAWTEDADAAEMEPALVRATSALDSWLRGRWKGQKKTSTQALAWPRIDVVDEEGYAVADTIVPAQVKAATAEIALIEIQGTTFIDQQQGNDDAIKSETIGPLSTTYRDGVSTTITYPHVEALLRGLASVGGQQIDMVISLTQAELDAITPADTDVDTMFDV